MSRVAVVGDVVATASPVTTLSGAPGAWTAGPVIESSYPKLTVAGKAVVWKAECTFTFTNSNTGATVVVPVTLTAPSTSLQGGTSNVLVDGNEAEKQGNKLTARASPTAPVTDGG
jgi:hypothetical protein